MRSDYHFRYLNKQFIASNVLTMGEAIIRKSNWVKIKELKPEYAGPRNVVSGLFMNKTPDSHLLAYIDYIKYESSEELDKTDKLDKLNSSNVYKLPYVVINNYKDLNAETLDRIYKQFGEKYAVDGLAIDVNSIEIRNKLGRETNLNPKYARAIKLPHWDQSYTSTVVDMTWEVSKTGAVKPVAVIKPTEIDGSTINNITGYNAKYVEENKIAPGAIVEFIKSGDIIPKHLATLTPARDTENILPKYCPSCNNLLDWNETKVDLICNNKDCRQKAIKELQHFFNVMKIDFFSDREIETLYDLGYKKPNDILTISGEKLLTLDRWGERKVERFLENRTKLQQTPVELNKLLHALNLFEGKIGSKTIKLIIQELGFDQHSINKLIELPGIKEKTAEVYLKGFENWLNSTYKEFMPTWFDKIITPEKPKQAIIDTKSVCFTKVRPDNKLKQLMIDKGYETCSNVNKKTDILVTKDPSAETSKTKNAKKLGIDILSLEEFEKLVN